MTDAELLNHLDTIACRALDYARPQSELTFEWALGQLGTCPIEQQEIVRRVTDRWNQLIVHLVELPDSEVALCGHPLAQGKQPRLAGRHRFEVLNKSRLPSVDRELCAKCAENLNQ